MSDIHKVQGYTHIEDSALRAMGRTSVSRFQQIFLSAFKRKEARTELYLKKAEKLLEKENISVLVEKRVETVGASKTRQTQAGIRKEAKKIFNEMKSAIPAHSKLQKAEASNEANRLMLLYELKNDKEFTSCLTHLGADIKSFYECSYSELQKIKELFEPISKDENKTTYLAILKEVLGSKTLSQLSERGLKDRINSCLLSFATADEKVKKIVSELLKDSPSIAIDILESPDLKTFIETFNPSIPEWKTFQKNYTEFKQANVADSFISWCNEQPSKDITNLQSGFIAKLSQELSDLSNPDLMLHLAQKLKDESTRGAALKDITSTIQQIKDVQKGLTFLKPQDIKNMISEEPPEKTLKNIGALQASLAVFTEQKDKLPEVRQKAFVDYLIKNKKDLFNKQIAELRAEFSIAEWSEAKKKLPVNMQEVLDIGKINYGEIHYTEHPTYIAYTALSSISALKELMKGLASDQIEPVLTPLMKHHQTFKLYGLEDEFSRSLEESLKVPKVDSQTKVTNFIKVHDEKFKKLEEMREQHFNNIPDDLFAKFVSNAMKKIPPISKSFFSKKPPTAEVLSSNLDTVINNFNTLSNPMKPILEKAYTFQKLLHPKFDDKKLNSLTKESVTQVLSQHNTKTLEEALEIGLKLYTDQIEETKEAISQKLTQSENKVYNVLSYHPIQAIGVVLEKFLEALLPEGKTKEAQVIKQSCEEIDGISKKLPYVKDLPKMLDPYRQFIEITFLTASKNADLLVGSFFNIGKTSLEEYRKKLEGTSKTIAEPNEKGIPLLVGTMAKEILNIRKGIKNPGAEEPLEEGATPTKKSPPPLPPSYKLMTKGARHFIKGIKAFKVFSHIPGVATVMRGALYKLSAEYLPPEAQSKVSKHIPEIAMALVSAAPSVNKGFQLNEYIDFVEKMGDFMYAAEDPDPKEVELAIVKFLQVAIEDLEKFKVAMTSSLDAVQELAEKSKV